MSASRFARSWCASAIALAAALAATGPSAAAEPEEYSIATPSGWEEDLAVASDLTKLLAETVTLDDLEKTGGAAAYIEPGTGGLYISWLQAEEKTDEPEKVIRTALDQLRASVAEAGLDPGQVEELEYNERRQGDVIDARMAWRHRENESITVTRTFLWQNPDGYLRLLRGECLFAEAKRDPVAEICRGALSSLTHSDIREREVGSLGAVAGPADRPPAEGAAEPEPASEGEPSRGPSIGEVDLSQPLHREPPKKESNRKNLWIFLVGAVLIVFAFYSATRSRRASEGEAPPPAGPGVEEEE